jgi:hypothetical protein
LIKEVDVRIFHRKSRWQQLSENLASLSKRSRIKKGGAAAAMGAAALTAASAAVSSYRRRTNA